jgi:hypothetical protein
VSAEFLPVRVLLELEDAFADHALASHQVELNVRARVILVGDLEVAGLHERHHGDSGPLGVEVEVVDRPSPARDVVVGEA